WNGDGDGYGSLKIYGKVEYSWVLDRQIGRLGASENLIHVGSRSPETTGNTRAIGHETADLCDLTADSSADIPTFPQRSSGKSRMTRCQQFKRGQRNVRARATVSRRRSRWLDAAPSSPVSASSSLRRDATHRPPTFFAGRNPFSNKWNALRSDRRITAAMALQPQTRSSEASSLLITIDTGPPFPRRNTPWTMQT